METPKIDEQPDSRRRERGLLPVLHAQFSAFGLVLGVQGVIWIEVMRTLGLGEGVFGTVMLVLPLIGLPVLAFNSRLYAGLGNRLQSIFSLALLGAGMVVIGTTSSVTGFAGALLLAGVGFAALDAATSSAGMDLEQATGRHVMNSLHGVQSGAIIVGALLTGFALEAGWDYRTIAIVSAVVCCLPPILLTVAAAYPAPQGDGDDLDSDEAGSLLKNKRLMRLASICFLGSAAEAVAVVWTVIYMSQIGASIAVAGLTFSLFNGAMFVGRFLNSPIVSKFGPKVSLVISGLGIVLSTVPLLLSDSVPLAIVAFVILGFAVAGVQPTSLSAAAPLAANTGAVTALIMMAAYAALLVAPTAYGWAAEFASTRAAMLLITASGAVAVLLSLRVPSREAVEPVK